MHRHHSLMQYDHIFSPNDSLIVLTLQIWPKLHRSWMILTNFNLYLAKIPFWCILGMEFRLSVQFSSKRDPFIICFEHFQIFRILNFRQNQQIFPKSGISAKNWSFFKNTFLSPHLLLYVEFDGIGRFPQKCIILFLQNSRAFRP